MLPTASIPSAAVALREDVPARGLLVMHSTKNTLEAVLRRDKWPRLIAHDVDELRLIRCTENRILANPQDVTLVALIFGSSVGKNVEGLWPGGELNVIHE
jgi:hypothetical protein